MLLQRVDDTPYSISSLLERSVTNQEHVVKIRHSDGVSILTKQHQVAAAADPKYCAALHSEYAHVR
jgi:hypothetical protein